MLKMYSDANIDALREKFVEELNSAIKELSQGNVQNDQIEARFRVFSERETRLYLEYIKTENFEDAFSLNRVLNKYARKVKEIADAQGNSYLYMMGYFTGLFAAYSSVLPRQNESNIFNIRLSQIIHKKNYKNVLLLLYRDDFVQNKTLCEQLNIKANYLHKIMKEFQERECVKRYSFGKSVFYSLSDPARKYVKNILGIHPKPVVDIDIFDTKKTYELEDKVTGICGMPPFGMACEVKYVSGRPKRGFMQPEGESVRDFMQPEWGNTRDYIQPEGEGIRDGGSRKWTKYCVSFKN